MVSFRFWDIMRFLFGSPVMYRVQEIKKGKKYVWFFDTDDYECIQACVTEIKKGLKEGHVFVPSSVKLMELENGN